MTTALDSICNADPFIDIYVSIKPEVKKASLHLLFIHQFTCYPFFTRTLSGFLSIYSWREVREEKTIQSIVTY